MRVTGADWERLGGAAETLAHFVGHRAFMRMREGHCAALEVRVDAVTGARDFFCGVYDGRPQVCRDLARGSPECEGERARKAEAYGVSSETRYTSTRATPVVLSTPET